MSREAGGIATLPAAYYKISFSWRLRAKMVFKNGFGIKDKVSRKAAKLAKLTFYCDKL